MNTMACVLDSYSLPHWSFWDDMQVKSADSSVVIGTSFAFFCGHHSSVVTTLEFQTNDMNGEETAFWVKEGGLCGHR